MNRLATTVAALGIAVLLAGCGKSERAPPAAASPSPPAATPASAADSAPGAAATAPTDRQSPTLVVATLDGGTFDLARHRGNWVVVNFWATWCGPCLKEMPELSALDAMRGHIDVIGLAYEEIEPDEMRAFLALHPVVYPIAILDPYSPPADFDTPRGLPMTVLIAPGGAVAKRILGPVTAKQIEAAIAAVDAVTPISPASAPAT